MSAIKLMNLEVEGFAEFLLDLTLTGKASRMRMRFIKELTNQLKTVQEEHQELIKQHSHLDEQGEPKTKEVDGQQVYDIKDIEAFNRDYNELLREEFIVEVTEANREMVQAVANAVLDTDKEFKGIEAIRYDRFCEIVEGAVE